MINDIVSAFELILILISSILVFYILFVRGDTSRSSYMLLLIDLCLLWTVLI